MNRDEFRDWLLSAIQDKLTGLDPVDRVKYYAELHKSPILYDNSTVIEVGMGTSRFIIKIDSFAKYVMRR